MIGHDKNVMKEMRVVKYTCLFSHVLNVVIMMKYSQKISSN